MDRRVLLHRIIPLPGLDAQRFEAGLREAVMAAVDTRPTRGGQITAQSAYRTGQGHYLWLVEADTFGGSWLDSNVQAAREELASIGVVFALDELEPITGSP
jgi:hypothetical protein